ncbi:MAG: PAS domain S-box protein [Desulfuromonadales bacterium]|nr:PAS domain S-box protein [Desulfuromonadales bacterium]
MIIQPETAPSARLLVVDDDVDFSASIKALVEIEGYLVETANSVYTALQRLHEFNPDIALVDLRLGAEEGTELVEKMTRLSPDLICVMVTAHSDTDSVIAALHSGVYDFLRKPFEGRELFAVLRRCSEKYHLLREKREVDQALHESDTRFRAAFEVSPDAIIMSRMDGTIIDVNPGFERLTGHRLKNVVGKNAMAIGLWKEPQERIKLLDHIGEYGYANNIVAEFRMFDGTIRTGLVSARTVMLNKDLCVHYVVRDVHDIMLREKALAASEERYRQMSQEFSAVLDGVQDAMMLIDADLKIVWANKGAGKHFGFIPTAMKGVLCQKIWSHADAECQKSLQEVFTGGKTEDIIQKMPDGRIMGVKSFPVRDDQGAVINVVQIASDLTEKMRLREESTRSAHLAAIGELAAGVAHEVNNPIGMMLLDLPLLKDVFSELIPLVKEHPGLQKDQKIAGLPLEKVLREIPAVIDEVFEGALKVKRIVEELRDFSRPTRGLMEPVDINEVARKAVRMVRNPLKNATDAFIETYSCPLLYTLGDPHRLEQVVVNLLLNACQALTEKSAKISIETKLSPAGGAVQLIVKDEGCGVDATQIKNMTNPFVTSKREAGGTGLGLSVSSRIVSEHHGLLVFESVPGEGTTVVVELPIVKPEEK